MDFVEAVHARYGAGPLEHTSLGQRDPDWDVLYPISSSLDTYRFPLPSTPFEWPKLSYIANDTESNGVRRIQLSLDFVSDASETHADAKTGIIWSILAFDGEVVDWSFDFDPPRGKKRHRFKIDTHIDATTVDFDIAVRNEGPLSIHWSAIGESLLIM